MTAQAAILHLAEHEKLIEIGWEAMSAVVLPRDAPQIQRDEMRLAFYGDVKYLLVMISPLNEKDPDRASDDEKKVLAAIDRELDVFHAHYVGKRHTKQ